LLLIQQKKNNKRSGITFSMTLPVRQIVTKTASSVDSLQYEVEQLQSSTSYITRTFFTKFLKTVMYKDNPG